MPEKWGVSFTNFGQTVKDWYSWFVVGCEELFRYVFNEVFLAKIVNLSVSVICDV